jgi:hypothetical protein
MNTGTTFATLCGNIPQVATRDLWVNRVNVLELNLELDAIHALR